MSDPLVYTSGYLVVGWHCTGCGVDKRVATGTHLCEGSKFCAFCGKQAHTGPCVSVFLPTSPLNTPLGAPADAPAPSKDALDLMEDARLLRECVPPTSALVRRIVDHIEGVARRMSVPVPPIDEEKLLYLIGRVLERGGVIKENYNAGMFATADQWIARCNKDSREFLPKFKALLKGQSQ